jgi:hypothetical protein
MPFKSEAQRRFMHAAEARGELPEGTAAHWSAETPKGKKLPDYAEKDGRQLRRLKRARKSKS